MRFARYGLLGQFSGSDLLDEICWAGVYWVRCFGWGEVLGGISQGFLFGIYLVVWRLARFNLLYKVYFLRYVGRGLLCWVWFAGSGLLGQVYEVRFVRLGLLGPLFCGRFVG